MTDSTQDETRSERGIRLAQTDSDTKSYRDKILMLLAGGIVTILVAAAVNFGGRVMTGSETAAVLTTQVETILTRTNELSKISQDMLAKQYTREDARADREIFNRQLANLDMRIADIGKQVGDTSRRMDLVEANQRMQQVVIDKFIAAGPRR